MYTMEVGTKDSNNSALAIDEDKNTEIMYLFPDTLTHDQLVQVLKKRMVLCKNKDHSKLQKEHLMYLFKKFIVPLPQRTQYKQAEDSQNPGEMLKYIKTLSSKGKRDPALAEEGHYDEPGKGINGEVTKTNEMNKPLKSIVRISTKSNEQQRKPVKLKRKSSRTTEDETVIIKRSVENNSMQYKQQKEIK